MPWAKKITLPQNYRSRETILKAAQTLIRHNPESSDVILSATRPGGNPVQVRTFMSPDQESEFVTTMTKNLILKGVKPSEIAVLYRSNMLSKVIEQRMRQAGIPYTIIGGHSFFDRKEIKDAIAYLTLAANPHDGIAFHRAISSPKRGLGDAIIGRIERACLDNKIHIFQLVQQMSLVQLPGAAREKFIEFCGLYSGMPSGIADKARYLLTGSGYLDYLKKYDQDTAEDRRGNLEELLSTMEEFGKSNPKSSLSEFLQTLAVDRDDKEDVEESVRLLTMHSAKGLEFDAVFIIGVEENIVPHKMTILERGEEGICEERRLMYVGASRARDLLWISYNRNRAKVGFFSKGSQSLPCKPSRFIAEMVKES